jgi:hypothetical protein
MFAPSLVVTKLMGDPFKWLGTGGAACLDAAAAVEVPKADADTMPAAPARIRRRDAPVVSAVPVSGVVWVSDMLLSWLGCAPANAELLRRARDCRPNGAAHLEQNAGAFHVLTGARRAVRAGLESPFFHPAAAISMPRHSAAPIRRTGSSARRGGQAAP